MGCSGFRAFSTRTFLFQGNMLHVIGLVGGAARLLTLVLIATAFWFPVELYGVRLRLGSGLTVSGMRG